jgi:mRNA-degrading endonuclease RelE of RelBE toxin-antitoxin system
VKAIYTDRFKKSFAQAPELKQRQFEKQVAFLLNDLRHPSLRVKIVDETKRIWQARVNGGWRFYFTIEGDTYQLLDIGPHPK